MNNLDQELDKQREQVRKLLGMCNDRTCPSRCRQQLDATMRFMEALITTQKQELLSEIEKELPPDAAITKEDLGVDLARKSAANAVLGQVKSIITTKREE